MTYSPKLEQHFSGLADFRADLDSLCFGSVEAVVASGFVNPFSYPLVAEETGIRDGFDRWYVDGGLLCRLSNLFRRMPLDRVSFDFSSVADDVFAMCDEGELRVALLGGTAEELDSAARYLSLQYPGAAIVFHDPGYFENDEIEGKIAAIVAERPQVVVVGLGTPKQERFVLRLKSQIQGPALLYTCGGFLSQTGRAGDYYPAWVKWTGLRWAYRGLMESHVAQRLVKDYPKFIIAYLVSGLKQGVARKIVH